MLTRHSPCWCFLGLAAATLVGCQPSESRPSAADRVITDVVDPATTDNPADNNLADLLIDSSPVEIVEPIADPLATDPTTNDAPPREKVGSVPSTTNTASGDEQVDDPVENTTLNDPSDPLIAQEDLTGMRQLTGRFVTIITDLPSSAEVNELPMVFDRAVLAWGKYFQVPRAQRDTFSMIGYVMQSKERFQRQGLLPDDLPPFLHGYQRGEKFWVYDQPSAYYRRHLVLHEGTHGFMQSMLGGTGAPWYREGMAEFLATHAWRDNSLQLGYMPTNREEVPYWGRIKLLKDAFADGKALMLRDVMRLESRDLTKVDGYAWSWAAATFLDSHPLFRSRFRALREEASDYTIRFTRTFEQQVVNELRELDESWQIFIANIEYGYDFERSAIIRRPGRPLPNSGATVIVKADRGWQSTGYRVEGGRNYLIRATGRCVLQTEPEVWPAEPSGITLRYYKGEPLGRLLGNVRFDQARPGLANLVAPLPIGLGRIVTPEDGGTLYLRINDSPAELADNSGEFSVQILPR